VASSGVDVKIEINKAFQETFKLIFGEGCELELDDLKDYMWRYHYPLHISKSAISGKEVAIAEDRYCKGARIIADNESGQLRAPALNIDDLKDIDSIIEAAREIFYYAGESAYGNSDFVYRGDIFRDSFYVYNAHHMVSAKYAAYSSHLRQDVDHVFGSSLFSNCRYLIKAMGAVKLARCFETYSSSNSSDLFACYDCVGCTHAMFSFNIRSKRYAIGNLELPKDKYTTLRKKLSLDSKEYMEKNRTFPSIFEIPVPSPQVLASIRKISVPKRKPERTDIKKIDDAWRTTCKILLGKDIGPLQKYEKFLTQRVNKIRKVKTVFGSDIVNSDMFFYKNVPEERMVNFDEAVEIAKQHVTFEDGGEVTLESIREKISPIAFFRMDFHEGENENNIETQFAYNAVNTYKVFDATNSRNCAYSDMILDSEYSFGSYRNVYSKFCIKCHSCAYTTASFEIDSTPMTSNSMFCHGCEAIDNCLFCFKVKNLRYAVGNCVVGKENYAKIKKIVADEIVQYLEKDGMLPFDIFTIACYKPEKDKK